MRKPVSITLVAACSALVLMGAAGESQPDSDRNLSSSAMSNQSQSSENRENASASTQGIEAGVPGAPAAAPLYSIDWYSVNSGGDINIPGTNFDLGVTVGEAVAGFTVGTQFNVGMGFWYGATVGACPIAMSGDVNLNGSLGTSDIITMVNYALKGGPDPLPCVANGDVNCDGAISLSDIIVLVNRVLKAGPDPCNVCTIIPSLWSCP